MMNDDEQQPEASQVSEDTAATEAQQPDDAGRKSRKRASKKARTEEPKTRQSKRHTASERTEKLRRIEEALEKGGVSLKAAVEAVGISDQTYYQWKRAEKPEGAASNATAPFAAPPSLSNELADLIKLEEENQRLRQSLGEKLRAENAELRRRLELY
ncbi:putative transposase [Rhizobium sp. PP-F2F-G38]|uniref:transposase n=1 Tax=Rhizobium sp. PP-CC-3G-465 TaxID=2135648 RepID=UPI000D9E1C14|nr:putative transposase [Rhizobium sp. PP-WC-1G-195]PYE40585.1 putative transposase [Rhizobium sp. PP-F2F-G20b]PYE93552.1 putative transposase [Rhizobium sp. PP-F2F-G38]TCL88949.1 putative transposase [Rhizobium sp. PP-WC-2G-219]TCP80684.1 putative transposase [Rhizobium sp. PP-CC-2G-626]TCQ19330.1 putative transposase [Rhizobium sp. PP-CC-3G-465]